MRKKNDLDFEMTLSILVGIVSMTILVFACCYASTRIIKLEERVYELESNNQTITEQRWYLSSKSRRKGNITSLHKTNGTSNRSGVKMNIIELYELNYDREVDSIPVLLNVSKKTFNFLRYNGIYNKKDKITLTIDEVLVDNIHIIKREEDSDELSGQ